MDEHKGTWELLCTSRESTEGDLGRVRIQWQRTTERMKVTGGWLYRTSTEHYNASGIVTACSESLCPVMDPKPSRK